MLPIEECRNQHDENLSVPELGFLYVLAPAVTEYMNWVLKTAIAQGKKRLYFLARDGYMMYHLAKKMAQARNLDMEIRYLKVSRFSVRSAEYYFSGQKALDTICVGGIDITFEKIMKRALLTEEESQKIAELAGYAGRCKEGLNYRQIQMLKETLREIPTFFEYIKKHSKECYENVCGYFRQEGLFDDVPYALVDSGWIGTLQMSMQRVINHAADSKRNICGYYFGLYGTPGEAQKGQYQSYYFGPKDVKRKIQFSNCLFETVFSSPGGMTLGYEADGGEYHPVPGGRQNPNQTTIRRLKKLLLEFGDSYLSYENASEAEWKQDGVNVVPKLLKLFMGTPTVEEAECYGNLQFCDDVLELQMQNVAADWNEEELKKQRFFRKTFIRLNIIKEQLHDSAWPEGSIVLLGKNVRGSLRQERLYKRFMYTRKAMGKKENIQIRKDRTEERNRKNNRDVRGKEMQEKVRKDVQKNDINSEIRVKRRKKIKSFIRKRNSFKQYAFVIRELTAREIKRKYARSSLGIIWSVLNPLLTMIVMSLIFSTMFRRSIENFPIYYLTGQIFWTLFSGATNSAMTALVDNKSLLIKAKLPKQTFVLSRVYTSLVNFGYTCIAYVLMLLVFRIRPGVSMLLFFVDVIFLLIFAMGIGYMLSVAYVFFADIKYLYSVLLTLLMYLSAIFYPVSQLPEAMQTFIGCNPVYVFIAFARECMMYGNVPEPMWWIKAVLWSMGSLAAGLAVFKANENKVMQRV